MTSAINSGEGIWNPLVWVIAFFLILIIAYIIRSIGNKKYNKNSAQVKPFLSGNIKNEKEIIRSSNLYWGFFESLKKIYSPLTSMHTGNINDYAGIVAFILVIILLLIILF